MLFDNQLHVKNVLYTLKKNVTDHLRQIDKFYKVTGVANSPLWQALSSVYFFHCVCVPWVMGLHLLIIPSMSAIS